MDQYQLGETKILEPNLLSDMRLAENVIHMKVQNHSRMQNLLGFAMNKIKGEEITQVVWSGEGLAVQKAVNCADIMKKRNKSLYMLSRKGFKRKEEYWDPIHKSDLDRLKVNIDTEAVSILLSKWPLDSHQHEAGYLAAGEVPASITSSQKSQPESQEKKASRPRAKHRPSHRPGKQDSDRSSKPKTGNKDNASNSDSRQGFSSHHSVDHHGHRNGIQSQPRRGSGAHHNTVISNNEGAAARGRQRPSELNGAHSSKNHDFHNGSGDDNASKYKSHKHNIPKLNEVSC